MRFLGRLMEDVWFGIMLIAGFTLVVYIIDSFWGTQIVTPFIKDLVRWAQGY